MLTPDNVHVLCPDAASLEEFARHSAVAGDCVAQLLADAKKKGAEDSIKSVTVTVKRGGVSVEVGV
jgi:hypothetical protein